MNLYYVQYKDAGAWVPLMILAPSIYEAEEWAREQLPSGGLCISKYEPWPEEERVDLW
jgi:hypothetical protein